MSYILLICWSQSVHNFFRLDIVTTLKTSQQRRAAILNLNQKKPEREKERIQIWMSRMKLWSIMFEKEKISVQFRILFHSVILPIHLLHCDRANESDESDWNILSEQYRTRDFSHLLIFFDYFSEPNLLQNFVLFSFEYLLVFLLPHFRNILSF